jgi:hypothetical protein
MTLYKTFLEPLNIQMGLLPIHIRTQLFWQCEQYANWPENHPGKILRKFLDSLYDKIKQMSLNDYFIEKRNLFESTPRKHMLPVQEKLLRMRENLVMHVLVALRNLRYIDSAFYPVLDYKKLYDIITRNYQTPEQSITANIKHRQQQQSQDEESEEEEEEETESNTDLWKGVTIHDRQKEWTRKVREQILLEKASQKVVNSKARRAPPIQRKMSTDCIDIKV